MHHDVYMSNPTDGFGDMVGHGFRFTQVEWKDLASLLCLLGERLNDCLQFAFSTAREDDVSAFLRPGSCRSEANAATGASDPNAFWG
jgi:hypothetical protein